VALALGGCGTETKTKTVAPTPGITNPASQIAPSQGPNGPVVTKVPVYAGDASAKRTPRGQAALSLLQPVLRPRIAITTPKIRGSAGTTVAQWLTTVDNDVGSFWQYMFNRSRLVYAPVNQSIFSKPVQTGCGRVTPGGGPFYCYRGSTIFLPLPWFVGYANPFGDAAIAVIVAHENGHHIQDLLGILGDARYRGVDVELQADCLAGIWAASVYRRGLLQPGDLQEAWTVTRAGGDAPGTPAGAPGAHGTPSQRLRSFRKGYNRGVPGACRIAAR
jgi:predicted metalloprotease